MNIGIIGTGYVGLVTGACLAEMGNNVICMDIDELKIKSLEEAKPLIYEPGLKELLERNTKERRLHFTTDLSYVVKNSFIIFIAVSTPPNGDGSADIRAVLDVARSIGECMDDYRIIVT